MTPPMTTPQTNTPLISARGLTKRFGDFTAVDGIDFEVARGESFGFLGPNGAGKTSAMRMISCLSPVTGGTLRVLGLDPAAQATEIKSRIGVVPQEDALDSELTAAEAALEMYRAGAHVTLVHRHAALGDTIKRAIQCYAEGEAFTAMQQRNMRGDFSWKRSAQAYIQLYQRAIQHRKGE